jgi:hypothetical protein
MPVVGGVLEASGTAAEGAARLLQAGTSLFDRQREVAAALQDLDQQVVVLIDDIDRLRSQEEIVEMVRLIRLVGDLPGLTYLLAYERNEVARALGDGDTKRGLAYLEKIVQATFELPPTRRDLLDRLLTAAMSQAVGDISDRRFDASRLQLLDFAGFRRLFRNVRDVRRFASALPAVVAAIDVEVELSDLLALEALRLFEPQVFDLIAKNPDALTSLQDDSFRLGRDRPNESKAAVVAMIDAAEQATIVQDLLEELFPAAARHLGGSSSFSSSFSGEWRRLGRVASKEILVTYLERGLPEGALSYLQVQGAVAALNDRAALEQLLNELEEPQLIALFARLEDYVGEFSLRDATSTIEVLSKAARRLRSRSRRQLEYDGHVAVSRLLLRLLRGMDEQAVEKALNDVNWPDLSTHAEVVRMAGRSNGAGYRVVGDAVANDLESQLVEAILRASSEQLQDERDLAHLIWRAEQREPDRTRERLSELFGNRWLLVRWLGQALLEKRSADGVSYLLPWSKLVKTADAEGLTAAVLALETDSDIVASADEREQEAMKQALRYAQRPDGAEDDLRSFAGDLDNY